ncbi:MFS general substrate transporter [Piedraia hortae CBS 480.64]|uniref:MFS general substrate transporter n=1 Tax=Piedraia hortae CBS 480.64 TaxID=1314780 RepID=A0A6A7C248_9PEZI|nr:MFS general substrate transporter [Piedraia hortae CBS 480.64]
MSREMSSSTIRQRSQDESPILSLLSVEEDAPRRSSFLKIMTTLCNIVKWVPPTARFDSEHPTRFSWYLALLFCFLSAAMNASLFWTVSVLKYVASAAAVPMAGDVPSFSLGAYASSLVLLCPIADQYRRRLVLLILILSGAIFALCLATTTSSEAYQAFLFLTGIPVIACQVLMAVIGEVVPVRERPARVAMVVSATQVGAIYTRVISLVLPRYSSWRYVYWVATSVQFAALLLTWAFMPDYPSNSTGLPPHKQLWSVWKLLGKNPRVLQASVLAFCVGAVFPSQWGLLRGAVFSGDGSNDWEHYSLVGAACLPIVITPLYAGTIGKYVTSIVTVCVGIALCFTGLTFSNFSKPQLLGPILQVFFAELGRELMQVGIRLSMFSGATQFQNGMEAIYVFWGVIGTMTANFFRIPAVTDWTSISTSTWRGKIPTLLFLMSALVVALARGPRERRWVGWCGGMQWRGTSEY